MDINHNLEKQLIEESLMGDYGNLIKYIEDDIKILATEFEKSERGIALEIPVASLQKSALKYIETAVKKYDEVLKSDQPDKIIGFSNFFKWFAEQGIDDYAHDWEAILNGGGNCSSCGHH